MDFGEALKKARESRGLTKWKVAKEVGVSWMTYWAWEKGKRSPRSTYLIRLLRLFPELWDLMETTVKPSNDEEKQVN